MTKTRNEKIKYIIYLQLLLFAYSFGGIFSKKAASFDFLSLGFIGCYGAVVFILFIYAFFWQQVIKHISLTTAFCNKSVEIIWGMLWGVLFFNEEIKLSMILGGIIVIIGVCLVVTADE